MKPTYKQVTKTRYIEQISQLAEEIFVQHYTKLTPPWRKSTRVIS